MSASADMSSWFMALRNPSTKWRTSSLGSGAPDKGAAVASRTTSGRTAFHGLEVLIVLLLIPLDLIPLDHLREPRLQAHEPRVQSELAAVVLLLGDAVMEPLELAPLLAVEAHHELEDRELARCAELSFRVLELRVEEAHELRLGLRAVGFHGVHAQELGPRRALHVGVRARQLAGHHHRDLEDVLHQLAHGSAVGRGAEVHAVGGDILELVTHALAREAPGFERFFEERLRSGERRCRFLGHGQASVRRWRTRRRAASSRAEASASSRLVPSARAIRAPGLTLSIWQ